MKILLILALQFAYILAQLPEGGIVYEDKIETADAVFETVHGNCPGNFLLPAPYFCPACGANNAEVTTLAECAKFCLDQGDECRGFTVSSADGKCYPKTIDGCAAPQQNGINLFFAKKAKSALHIYNFTIDHVNPGQPATARCLVSGFPAPTQASNFRFEYSNGTKVNGDITVNLLAPTAVEATIVLMNVVESGQYVLCTVNGGDNGRASEWALTHIFTLPVIPAAPQIADSDFPVFRLVKWRPFQEGDIGDGPVDSYYLYIRKENEDWGIYGKTEIAAGVACGPQPGSMCQKRIGPLQLNTRYAVSVAAIRQGYGGVGKMSPITMFKTPCENVTDITTPPVVLLDPSSPGHVTLTWDRRGELCVDPGFEEQRIVAYRILFTSLVTGWTLDTNVTAPGPYAACLPSVLPLHGPSGLKLAKSVMPAFSPLAADNCSSLHLYEMAQNSFYDVQLIRISAPPGAMNIRTPLVRFKTPCGKPFAKVINIRVADWARIPNSNLSNMVLAWSPISPRDTGCDSVERYLIRIFDRHPSVVGTFPIRNLTVTGSEYNATVTRMSINVPYYVIVSYRNNEGIDSPPSELVPFRLEPEAAAATKGTLPGIDMTLLIGLVVGAVVLTICLTALVIFIIMKGKRSSYSSDTDSPPSNRKSSVSSTDLPPAPNGVYINVNGNSGAGLPLHHHTTMPQHYGVSDHDVEAELVGKSRHSGGGGHKKQSRRRSSGQHQQENVMYSKAVRSNRNSMSSGNGHVNHVETQDEAVYNTRLDAAIGHQKF